MREIIAKIRAISKTGAVAGVLTVGVELLEGTAGLADSRIVALEREKQVRFLCFVVKMKNLIVKFEAFFS